MTNSNLLIRHLHTYAAGEMLTIDDIHSTITNSPPSDFVLSPTQPSGPTKGMSRVLQLISPQLDIIYMGNPLTTNENFSLIKFGFRGALVFSIIEQQVKDLTVGRTRILVANLPINQQKQLIEIANCARMLVSDLAFD